MSTRNINVNRYEDEYALFGKALPYIAMLIGGVLAFLLAVITRLTIHAQVLWGNADVTELSRMVTLIIVISAVILSPLAYKLFRSRDQFHHFISVHALITTVLVHGWLIMAVWQDKGDWIFGAPTLYTYFYGGLIIGLSWCIRRWAYRGEDIAAAEERENVFAAIGLGSNTYLDKEKSYKTSNGAVYRMKLTLGKKIEDAKGKAIELAQIAGKSRNLVHVSETDSGVEGEVDVTILDENPFKEKRLWQGPELPGESIVAPIGFATYDTGQRGMIHIAGKDGGSSQHFLTVGMPGTGKSKAWQAIYGTVLARREVSVIFGDPAKGMQTGGPLADKLAWFAWSEADCIKQLDAVINAVEARTNYLTSMGLSHWESGCGLNFLIFHLEEAARFAKVSELIELVEAARSAGISIVISLQRGTSDRINTSARYNLGANMCFGVKAKRDAEFGLSEYARQAGASPHLWQDRYPGHFYLEALGIDPRLAAHSLLSDWIDVNLLESHVNSYPEYPLDNITADALGSAYQGYRDQVESGETAWQQMRRNRGFRIDTQDWNVSTDTKVLSLDDIVNIDLSPDQPTNTIPTKPQPKVPAGTDPYDKAKAVEDLKAILKDWYDNGKTTFTNKELGTVFTTKSTGWISTTLGELAEEGILVREGSKKEGFWKIVRG